MKLHNILIISALKLIILCIYSCHPNYKSALSGDKSQPSHRAIETAHEAIITDRQITKNRGKYNADWQAYKKKSGFDEKTSNLTEMEKQFKAKYSLPLFANVRTVADHIDHIVRIAGIEYAGLGYDFDGVGDSLPEGLKDVSQYPNLIDELLKRGYSPEDIEKICYKNVWRVWNSVQEYAQNH